MSTKFDIKQWIEEVWEEAETWVAFLETFGKVTDDTFGWGTRITRRLKVMDEEGCQAGGILLTGPAGCGKHTVATHAVLFWRNQDYACIRLDGAEFEWGDLETCTEVLAALCDRAGNEGKSLCLFLENLEDCTYRKSLLTYLGRLMCHYSMNVGRLLPFFLILIDQQEETIPSELRRMLERCKMSLPDETQRIMLIKNRSMDLDGIISVDLFAEVTNGLTYAQLVDLIKHLESYVELHREQGVAEEEVRRFLTSQLPERSHDDNLDRLITVVESFGEKLPQLLSRAVPVAQNVPKTADQAKEEILQNYDQTTEEGKKELEELTSQLQDKSPYELSEIAFGADFYSSVVELSQQQTTKKRVEILA